MKRFSTALALVAGLGLGTQADATIIYDQERFTGEVLGARNIEIAGQLYDVEFLNGSCAQVFQGCNESSDFLFQTEAEARAAAQVLMDQVFAGPTLNPTVGSVIDIRPNTLRGCENPRNCETYTLFGDFTFPTPTNAPIPGIIARNVDRAFEFSRPEFEGVRSQAFAVNAGVDLTQIDSFNWARWTRQVTVSVSEPSTALLLGLGIFLLVYRTGRMNEPLAVRRA